MSAECYVLDCSMDRGDGFHCFCPVKFDNHGEVEAIVVGLNYISTDPPENGRYVGVVHMDGQEACDAWVDANRDEYERLREFAEARP